MKQSKAEKQIDKQIADEYYKQGNRVQIHIMDIPKIYDDCRRGMILGRQLPDCMAEAIARYRTN